MKFKFVLPVLMSVLIASCSSDDDPAPNNQASIVITPNTIAAQLVGKWRLDSVRTYNYILNGTGLDNQYVGSKIEFTSNINTPMTGNACLSNYYVNLITLKDNGSFLSPANGAYAVSDVNCGGSMLLPTTHKYLLEVGSAACPYLVGGYIETISATNLVYVWETQAPSLLPQINNGFRTHWKKIP